MSSKSSPMSVGMSKATDKPGLSLVEEEPVALVGVPRAPEAGELAHRPDLVAVHGPVDAAGVREGSRLAQVALHVDRRRFRVRTRSPSGSPPSVSGGMGGAARPPRLVGAAGRRCPPGRSSGSLVGGFPAVPVEDAFGQGVRVHPAQIAFELSTHCALMERISGPLGRALDDDRLDLGPQPRDPATLELPGGADRIAVPVDRRHQFVDALAGLGDGGEHRRRPTSVRTWRRAGPAPSDRGPPWMRRGGRPCSRRRCRRSRGCPP